MKNKVRSIKINPELLEKAKKKNQEKIKLENEIGHYIYELLTAGICPSCENLISIQRFSLFGNYYLCKTCGFNHSKYYPD